MVIEIGEALARDIPVVPVMIDGAPLPDPDLLPEDLKELADRQAQFVEFRTFDYDVARLIRNLGLTEKQVLPTHSGNDWANVPQGPEERYLSEGRIQIDATHVDTLDTGNWFLPGAGKAEWFKDIDVGPEMVVVPAGKFMMGSPKDEPERESWQKGVESPQHEVTIVKPFAVGRCAIAFDEWDAYVADAGGDTYKPKDQGWGRGRRPVINVSWDDAQSYIAWLSKKAGQPYRLLSEAEWEYAARAGTMAPFWWGKSITTEQANYDGNFTYEGGGNKGKYRKKTVSVDDFDANPWGLYNVHGNVWEWCEDVWHDNYKDAPADGSVWLEGGGDKSRRVVRGGSWVLIPRSLRSANRNWDTTDFRDFTLGFRLARTLTH